MNSVSIQRVGQSLFAFDLECLLYAARSNGIDSVYHSRTIQLHTGLQSHQSQLKQLFSVQTLFSVCKHLSCGMEQMLHIGIYQ